MSKGTPNDKWLRLQLGTSDYTVIELKIELDKCVFYKKGTKSALAVWLKSFGDHVNIAIHKGENGGTSTIVSATSADVSNDDATTNNDICDVCCRKILDGKEEAVQCEGVCSLWFHRYCAGISAIYTFQNIINHQCSFCMLHLLST